MSDRSVTGLAESVVTPSAEIVDAHFHLWDDKAPRLPDYKLADFRADASCGHLVTHTVYVECGWAYSSDRAPHLKYVGETEAVAAVANTPGHPILGAIIPFADLSAPELGELLDAHIEAGRGLVTGVRQSTAYDADTSVPRLAVQPPPELMDTDEFRSGLAYLGERGLAYDAFIYHPQIPKLAEAARAAPGTSIVLGHLGAPLSVGRYAAERAEVFAKWRDGISELSECPNVFLKIGGLGWPPIVPGLESPRAKLSTVELVTAWQPFVSHGIAMFGSHRCLAESNFPMDKVTCSYLTLWNAMKILIGDLPTEGQRQVLSQTARGLYKF